MKNYAKSNQKKEEIYPESDINIFVSRQGVFEKTTIIAGLLASNQGLALQKTTKIEQRLE